MVGVQKDIDVSMFFVRPSRKIKYLFTSQLNCGEKAGIKVQMEKYPAFYWGFSHLMSRRSASFFLQRFSKDSHFSIVSTHLFEMVNPLTPVRDQDRISPLNNDTISIS